MTNKSNILLCRGCPRSNIPRVEAQNTFLPCDKLLVRFRPEFDAYTIMREEFLKHPQYTHMVLATDDIVVRPEHIKQLQKDLEKHDYPVLTGMMNVDQDDKEFVNLTYILPTKSRQGREYKWYTRDVLPKKNIFEVAFSGFPLMAIRRDIVEGYPTFAADKIYQGLPCNRGASLDLVFCWHCKDNNIKIRVDKRIDMEHRRTSGEIRVNKERPKTEWMMFK